MSDGYEPVEPGSLEAQVIEEELGLLAKVQKQLAKHQIDVRGAATEYDQELIALRDQIAEARAEDVAPLVSEMYRMQALGAANGKGRDLPVDVNCPYFGHLKLNDGKKSRDVLVGSRGFVKAGNEISIVDWRNAPVSRIYYCYEEGDDYDERFGDRPVSGMVEARRTVGIIGGELRRVAWATGSVARRGDGEWVRIPDHRRPQLRGGAGVASRPSADPKKGTRRGADNSKLGVVGDESLREDKHLREITALIDPQQFDLITQPDSGIVILQGGAGSGKTTVALHRAAYLHYENPSVFSPKKMVVVVKSEPLTEYIARVLPSLDVAGTEVITLENWMRKTRRKVLPELKQKYCDDVPGSVARLKKHPQILRLLEAAIDDEAAAVGDALIDKADEKSRKAVRAKWDGMRRLAYLPRIREMNKWIEGGAAVRVGVTNRGRSGMQGVLRRARAAGQDIHEVWGDVLTDRKRLNEAFANVEDGPSTSDIEELVRWVSYQNEEPPPPPEKDDDEDRDPADIGHGIDGRHLDDGLPHGLLDPHDDALLLKLTQLRYGGLPIAGSQRAVTYEHVIVDEAQDLSPTDVSVLHGSLTKRESMTLAGDTAQKLIFDNGFEDWNQMLTDVGIEGVTLDQLKISYRSTKPIMLFSQHVLGPLADPEPPIVPRDGVAVEQFSFGSTGEALAYLGEALRSLVLRERKANCALVTRYAAQADIYYQGLKKSEVPALRRVYGKEFSFSPGVDVVDVTQVKGLEYDYVILAEVNASSYPEQKEARHLLHIAATRAVHQLWVTSVEQPSLLLPPSELD